MAEYYNPYQDINGITPLKVNFHTHAGVCIPGKCGELPLDDVAKAYRRAGYGALAISNHDMYLPREKPPEGIALLDAVEYSAHPHMLLVGADSFHETGHQQAIDETRASGGFVILCHPNWMRRDYLSYEMLDRLTGFTGLEILNPVIYRLKGSGLALDKWDYLLSRGRLVYGFGNDDFHQWRDMERAYNMIYAERADHAAIREAAEKGKSYVSNGVFLREFRLEGHKLYVKAGFFGESYIDSFTYRFVGENGRLLNEISAPDAAFSIPDGEPYVRVEAVSEWGTRMYLQPVTHSDYFGQGA